MHACVLGHFSRVCLFVTLWTAAHQAPPSMGISRQEYWGGLPCPPPGDLPNSAIEPASLTSPVLAGRFFTISTIWEAPREVPKRPNRKIDVFLQTNKTYSQVHDVASEGDGLDFNLYFHPRANLLNTLGSVWPWVNFLTSMIVLHILGRWKPMRKASGLRSFVLRMCPEVMYLLGFLCGQESSVLKIYLSISQSPAPLHSMPPKGPHPPVDSPPWGCASSAPLCADS